MGQSLKQLWRAKPQNHGRLVFIEENSVSNGSTCLVSLRVSSKIPRMLFGRWFFGSNSSKSKHTNIIQHPSQSPRAGWWCHRSVAQAALPPSAALIPGRLTCTSQAAPPQGIAMSQPSIMQATFTLWKINMEPENHRFVEESSLPKVHFQVPCRPLPGCKSHGSFRVCLHGPFAIACAHRMDVAALWPMHLPPKTAGP